MRQLKFVRNEVYDMALRRIFSANDSKFIKDVVQSAKQLDEGLDILIKSGLDITVYSSLLFHHIQFACGIAKGLSALKKAGLLEPENVKLLTKHADYAESIARGLDLLNGENLATKENFLTLIWYRRNLSHWKMGNSILNQLSQKIAQKRKYGYLVNQNTFNEIINHINGLGVYKIHDMQKYLTSGSGEQRQKAEKSEIELTSISKIQSP